MHRAAAATAASPPPSCCAKASSLGSSRPRARAATSARRHVAAAAAAGINGDDTNDSDDAKKKNPLPLNGYARPLNGASYAANGASSSSSTPPPPPPPTAPPSFTWDADAFPAYLQSEVDDFCSDWELALTEAEQRQQMRKKEEEGEQQQGEEGGGEAAAARPLSSSSSSSSSPASSSSSRTAPVSPTDPVWLAIRREAQRDAADEPLLSSFLYASILSHPGFARSLAFVLANRLSDATLLATELMEVFESVLAACPWVQRAALHDIVAVRERDPACRSYADGMLYFKGYQAVQVHRIAHELWLGERSNGGKSGGGGKGEKGGVEAKDDDGEGGSATKSGVRASRVMARMLQSRVSEVFAVDIHPAATLGRGLLLDHGTGVVIGETAVVGDNVSILQNVTLGGTGKDAGDRHPKVEDNVLIGAAATILGNITVGRGAQVAAGSLVLKPVPPRTAVAGSPAQVVGLVRGNPALRMQQWVASLDGKAAPAWESAMCPPPSSSQSSSPQTDAASSPQSAPQQEKEEQEQQEEREINRRLYPRRAEEPSSSPFVPLVAKAKSPLPTPTTPTTQTPPLPPKRPSPPPPSTPSKPKQPPGKREQEPEFFI